MSRRELAELINAHLAARNIGYLCMDANHIGKYERGEHHWPLQAYRQALRAVLGAQSDADLGFYTRRCVIVDTMPGPLAVPARAPVTGGLTLAALTERLAAAATLPTVTASGPVEAVDA